MVKRMNNPIINYDETSDTLYVSFIPEAKATGIELNDHILLRIDKKAKQAIGLTFFDYSLLTQKTEMGLRSFPLSGLADLSENARRIVLQILQSEPVVSFLNLSAFTPSFNEMMPITTLSSRRVLETAVAESRAEYNVG